MLGLDDVRVASGAFELRASWQVARGSRTAVIGPSGAGKSTLLNAIAGFHPLAAGRIHWEDRAISGLRPAERPISMLFQDSNLFPHLTIAQNVGLGIRPDLRLDEDQKQRVAQVLSRVGLDGLGARRPSDVSGGQQSRAALARVLVQNRPLILLDEPFAALGPAMKADMLDLVRDLTEETQATLLMVSHDPNDALQIASHVVVVADGLAMAPAATKAVFETPPPALRAYLRP